MIKGLKKLHTTEPACHERSDADHLRFVVHQKKDSETEFSFMIELNGTRTWTVNDVPSMNPLDQMHASEETIEESEMHDVFSYHSEKSFAAWDTGNYIPIDDFGNVLSEWDAIKCLEDGVLKFFLQGSKLIGEFTLMKKDDKNWLLIKRHDEFALYKNYSFEEMES
jgi:hypothetical protein